ncbi:hypothetical protein GCM10017559_15920 [Streptosporangium longisporum]|uniref:Uncharacterized protein n=1 Tax=Streptosporangium longisporum TaxID=46187 RepID=A0ABN3XVG9_9ACTN
MSAGSQSKKYPSSRVCSTKCPARLRMCSAVSASLGGGGISCREFLLTIDSYVPLQIIGAASHDTV